MANTMGTRIADYRRKKGVTQDQLAEHMGVSCQAVSKWENDISCPDITLLPQLADYFGVSVDELLRGHSNDAVKIVDEGERKDLNKLLLRVVVNSTEGDVVNINLPMSLIQVALDIGMQIPEFSGNEALKNVDFASILLAAERGVIGKLVEVKSAKGDIVEITIE